MNKKAIPDGLRKKRRPAGSIPLLAAAIACTLFSCAGTNGKKSITMHSPKTTTNKMKTVLIIGINPATIDFSNPELPKGLTREMVVQGTQATLAKLDNMGYQAEAFFIDTGAKDLSDLIRQLQHKKYDGIVVGNGIRGQSANFILFEQLINVIHANAAGSKIIFNTLPTNTDEAVSRWL